MITRRRFFSETALMAGGIALLKGIRASGADTHGPHHSPTTSAAPAGQAPLPSTASASNYTPVVIPNGSKLPWKLVDGVKVYHLVASEVDHEIVPKTKDHGGMRAKCWGYNGQVHGPAIEAVDGDRVRIYVTNKLPAATSVHWHSILLPNGMDGVGGLTQRSIRPGETFKYEFTLRQSGTAMYHAHHDEMTQIALGLTGLFIIHPRKPQESKIDRDFGILLHEWSIPVGASRPNPNEMTDFNLFTMNGKAFPGTSPLVVKTGERVRIRIGNLSPMSHHPIHLHGFHFKVTGTDGGQISESAQWPEATVLVPVGSTRTIEFLADAPGDWALHCHMTHHVANQMGDRFPNMVGFKTGNFDNKMRSLLPEYMTMGTTGMGDMPHMGMPVPANSIPMLGEQAPLDYITMGGMFTILKVRDHLTNYDDPGWYHHPPETLAQLANAADMKRDGIVPDGPAKTH